MEVGESDSSAAPVGDEVSSRNVDCRDRAEGSAPSRRPKSGRNVAAGPITFVGLRRAARAPKRQFTSEPGGYLGWKTGVVVRADTSVTVSFSGPRKRVLKFDYPGGQGRPVTKVTFRGCAENEPAFSHNGVVGKYTGFSGGLAVVTRRCVRLRIAVAGSAEPIFRKVSLGAGNCKQTPGHGSTPGGTRNNSSVSVWDATPATLTYR